MYILLSYTDNVVNKIEYCSNNLNVIKVKIKRLLEDTLFNLKLDNPDETYKTIELSGLEVSLLLIDNKSVYNVGIINKDAAYVYIFSVIEIYC
jgi:hypothetical protein